MNYKEIVEKVIKFTLGLESGKNTGHKDTVGEIFHHNNKTYKVIKIYPDFNKPFGNMYHIDGIYLICINGNANKEDNDKEIEYFLNLDNPFKGIFEGLCNNDITMVEKNSVFSELVATQKLLDYEYEHKSTVYDTSCKALTFYKLGIMQGKRQARRAKGTNTNEE